MEITRTYWPDESETSFDVALIEAISDHTDRPVMDLPAIGDVIDLDAVTVLIQAETRTNLDFDVGIPCVGMGVDGDPVTMVTVNLETGPDDPVHITVTDSDQDPGGIGAAPRLW